MAQLHCLKYKANEKSVTRSERQERLKALKFITSNLKVQEFLVLASQPLTALRDKLYCLTDQLMQKAQQHAPSGYFLIENVFYNDLRDPNATNYSKPIIDWLSNNRDEALQKWKAVVGSGLRKDQKPLFQSSVPSDRLPYFRAADMATTCFADLRCRLGVCYLYCHQGDCKHNIVIRDMRLLDSQDVQNKMAYPLLTFQPRVRHRKCNICDIYRAKKVTYDDKFAPKNPSYFCDCCYYLLHYSSDGYLLYDDFRAYDYYHE
eukprot:TRINITY_DN6288_c0_g1_i1.p1 TRINITY_DN6288_c0_g1~~TRINITY_DN6288_c0_g1_i1.p1  ORF type:complete len:268 (-),score=38.02 TRINITY_DN6288_c0_g1_i1:13-795(-)